mmetsp:Transcript_30154/g.68001  ORF Transcript_30154/g.68001 Transcript_30154/m.68001 type:complete len:88 (-) Transcript_30154:19-282(-)
MLVHQECHPVAKRTVVITMERVFHVHILHCFTAAGRRVCDKVRIEPPAAAMDRRRWAVNAGNGYAGQASASGDMPTSTACTRLSLYC